MKHRFVRYKEYINPQLFNTYKMARKPVTFMGWLGYIVFLCAVVLGRDKETTMTLSWNDTI